MSISNALLPEFDHEMSNTRRTLERVPDDMISSNTFVAYAPDLEDEILPQADDIVEAIVDLSRY